MLGRYQKSFQIVAGTLIFALFIPLALPFSKNIAYAETIYDPEADAAASGGYDPNTVNSNDLPGTGDTGASTGNTVETGVSKHPFTDGTAEGLASVTAGCGNIAGRFTQIITNMATDQKTTITLDEVNSLAIGTAQATKTIIDKLNKASSSKAASSTTTKDEEAIKELKALNQKEKDALKKETERQIWEQCLNGIAYKVAKQQLAFMTQSIFNWVNTGFGGDPLFVRDQDSFFKKIRSDNLQAFITPLTDPKNAALYPYGKDVARILINAQRTGFSETSRSTFANSLPLGITPDDFSNDFARGGWDAWLSLTQNPANNPLGFSMLAAQEERDQAARKQEEKREELAQGKGFLSVSKCVEHKAQEEVIGPGSVTKQTNPPTYVGSVGFLPDNVEMSEKGFSMTMHYDAPSAGTLKSTLVTSYNTLVKPATTVSSFTASRLSDTVHIEYDDLAVNTKYRLYITFFDASITVPNTGGKDVAIFDVTISPKEKEEVKDPLSDVDCIRRETVTPGSLIADQVSSVLTSPVRQLELADTVNQSLDSVFGAMVNQLTTNGFSSLSSYTSTRNYYPNGSSTGGIKYYDGAGQLITVNHGFGGWYGQAGNFDITKDLGDIYVKDRDNNDVVVKKGVIGVQKDYITAAKDTRESLVPILNAVGNLDYCIPGPNPNWINVTNERLADMKDYVASQEYGGRNLRITPLWANAVKATAGVVGVLAVIVPVGTIIGAVIGVAAQIFDAIQSSQNEHNKTKLAENYAYGEDLFYANIKTQLTGMDEAYDNYTNYINERYGNLTSVLPMAYDGMQITRNLSTYAANISEADKEYENEISEVNTNIKKLQSIKAKVDVIVKAARLERARKIAKMKRDALPGAVNFCPGVDTPAPVATGVVDNGNGNGTGGNAQ
jgi:hypothetical protein